jgi:hypothetical protein
MHLGWIARPFSFEGCLLRGYLVNLTGLDALCLQSDTSKSAEHDIRRVVLWS